MPFWMSASPTCDAELLRDRGHEKPGAHLLLGVGVDLVVDLRRSPPAWARCPIRRAFCSELQLHHPALLLDERGRHRERVLLVELARRSARRATVSARSLSIFSRRVWTSARSSTSVWKLPTSLANSSSSAGRMRCLHVLDLHVERRRSCPSARHADAGRGTWRRRRTCRPTFLPTRAASSSGSAWPDPSSSCTPSPPASFRASPVDRRA